MIRHGLHRHNSRPIDSCVVAAASALTGPSLWRPARLPEVREAADHFKGTDLVILGLHDSSGTLEQVAGFAAKRALNYPLAIDRTATEEGWFGQTFAAYGVRSIPGAAVIDRQGKIAFVGGFNEPLGKAASLLTTP